MVFFIVEMLERATFKILMKFTTGIQVCNGQIVLSRVLTVLTHVIICQYRGLKWQGDRNNSHS